MVRSKTYLAPPQIDNNIPQNPGETTYSVPLSSILNWLLRLRRINIQWSLLAHDWRHSSPAINFERKSPLRTIRRFIVRGEPHLGHLAYGDVAGVPTRSQRSHRKSRDLTSYLCPKSTTAHVSKAGNSFSTFSGPENLRWCKSTW